jgi:signal transduction histidine kinase
MPDARFARPGKFPYALFGAGWQGRASRLFGAVIPLSSEGDKRKDLIQIQWFVTIACCYLLLFDKDKIVYHPINLFLLLAPLGSILLFLRLPPTAFNNHSFPQTMAVLDTVLLCTAIVFNSQSPWDLVLVFFFGIFIAAMGENLVLIIVGCLVLSVVSVFIVPLSGKGEFEFDSATLLRVPLLFGASVVYGYLSDQVKQEKRKTAHLEASRTHQLRMKDQFLSHVSHELRTPLTAVYQFITILWDGLAGDLNDEQREYVGIVLRNVKQLQAMVGDLLEATRADSGKLAIDPQVILLQSFVPQTVAMLMPGAAAKGIGLSTELPEDLPFVYADPQRVNQILTNLIDNGMKFTATGGQVAVHGEVLERDPGWIHMSVRDTGCGITPEGTQKIFDRLYQEKRTLDTNRKGLGLGLHICKELVSRHGGRIWVDSQLAVGSTFHFTLPVYSLATLVLPLVKARDRLGRFIELILVELRLEKLPANSEAAKAAWRAAWNSLNQLRGARKGTAVLPKMAAHEEQGLIFTVTTGDVSIEEIKSAVEKGVADCAAVRHSTCRITASTTLSDFANKDCVNLEQCAADAAASILKAIAQIEAEKSKAVMPRLDFVGEMSREIRTPATVVMGYASILRDKLLGELTPEQETVVTRVLTEINDLMLMVGNIFEAERIGSSTDQPASHNVDVGGLLRELRSIYSLPQYQSVAMVWDYPEDLPIIVSDGNKLRLILQNLIHEAVKSSIHGEVAVNARYSSQIQNLEFAVMSTGIGFSREGAADLFHRCQEPLALRGDSVAGKNWGAYLVHACTEILGGRIVVENNGNGKSIVTVKLPVRRAPEPVFETSIIRPGTVSKATGEHERENR